MNLKKRLQKELMNFINNPIPGMCIDKGTIDSGDIET